MKKYSKPVVKGDVVNDINEAVFLGGSGPGWQKSECYFSAFTPTQIFSDNGVVHEIFQCNIQHNCLAGGLDDHWVYAQYTIFTFETPVPAGVTGSINGYPLEFSPDREQARAVTGWDNNANDQIGLGNFELLLNNVSADSVWVKQIEFYDDGVNPYNNFEFRHPGDSIRADQAWPGEENWGGSGGWITPTP